jgi:poly-beta-1,6-N-acetyl-D-glucosamine synthase
MMEQSIALLQYILAQPELLPTLIVFLPLAMFFELPLYMLILLSIAYNSFHSTHTERHQGAFYPRISCIISGYDEGESIKMTLHSLFEQLYPGILEILVIIDGADLNVPTMNAVRAFMKQYPNTPKRIVQLIPKKTRGGHASSINLGIKLAKSKYILVLDGDSSCDNDMLSNAIENFKDPNIVGLSGMIRVRNDQKNLLVSLQAIEYLLGIHMGRLGLSVLKSLNIISSTFGIFRRDFLIKIGGWKNGTAEDLDLTIRIQAYFKRYPNLKMLHDSRAVVHTDAPETLLTLLKQRWRWEGDLFYIYIRRHWQILRPRYLGWPLFIITVWSSLLLQLIMPIATLFYLIYLIFNCCVCLIGILALSYLFYFILSGSLFSFYLLFLSERKNHDLKFLIFLPLMPIYQLLMRLWAGIALIYEIIFKTHRGSSMAPWWVLRKAN